VPAPPKLGTDVAANAGVVVAPKLKAISTTDQYTHFAILQ
jgi:hypothetical protein